MIPRPLVRVLMLAGAFLVAGNAARADTVSFFSAGAGKQTCADYLHASEGLEPNALQYNQRSQRTFVSDNAIYDQWILGFLSAMNLSTAADGTGKSDIQVKNVEIIGWVRSWCGENPNASVFEGAYHFVKDQWARRANP